MIIISTIKCSPYLKGQGFSRAMHIRSQGSLGVTLKATYPTGDGGGDDRGGKLESVIGSDMVGYLRMKILVSILDLKSDSFKLGLSRAIQLTRSRYTQDHPPPPHSSPPFQVQVHLHPPGVLPPHCFLCQSPPP